MTCIVAVTDGESIVLGGDSAGSAGSELRIRADPKVFLVGGYAIGFTTSFRMGQILRFGLELPAPPAVSDAEEIERFLVTTFIPTVRQAYADHGFAKTARQSPPGTPSFVEQGQAIGGLFLLGVAGRIFEVREDFQVARPSTPYSAVGAGGLVALGALHALESSEQLSLRDRARRALEAAEQYCTSVRAPFRFVELPAL